MATQEPRKLTEAQQIAQRLMTADGSVDWDRFADAQTILSIAQERDEAVALAEANRSALIEAIVRLRSARRGRSRVPFRDLDLVVGLGASAPRPWESR